MLHIWDFGKAFQDSVEVKLKNLEIICPFRALHHNATITIINSLQPRQLVGDLKFENFGFATANIFCKKEQSLSCVLIKPFFKTGVFNSSPPVLASRWSRPDQKFVYFSSKLGLQQKTNKFSIENNGQISNQKVPEVSLKNGQIE